MRKEREIRLGIHLVLHSYWLWTKSSADSLSETTNNKCVAESQFKRLVFACCISKMIWTPKHQASVTDKRNLRTLQIAKIRLTFPPFCSMDNNCVLFGITAVSFSTADTSQRKVSVYTANCLTINLSSVFNIKLHNRFTTFCFEKQKNRDLDTWHCLRIA